MGAVKRFGARLGTEHIGGTWMLIACAEFVLAFATASTLFQFGSANDGWSWGASVAGGIVCPALGVLLIAGDPGRYRTFGYPVRAWLVDHTVLGVILLLVFFADPVFSLLRGETHGAPAGIVVVPVLTVAAVVAAVLVHHRHLLTGRTRRENTRQAWYDRVFLARSGPLLWRVVYQPVGLVALVAAVVVMALSNSSDSYSLPAGAGLIALVSAPVVAASQNASGAVGMPRRRWSGHVVVAVAAPVVLVTLIRALGITGDAAEVKVPGTGTGWAGNMEPAAGTALLLVALVFIVAGLLAGALAVVFSYEDLGTGILWMVFVNIALTLFPQFQWEGMSQTGSGLLHLGWTVIITVGALSYARHRVMTGQPDWFGTRIIRSAQRKALA
jgi:hypothetical protein